LKRRKKGPKDAKDRDCRRYKTKKQRTSGFNKIILNGVSFPKICRAETGLESMQRRALGSTLSTIRSRTIVLNPKEAHYLIGIGLDILFPDLGENS